MTLQGNQMSYSKKVMNAVGFVPFAFRYCNLPRPLICSFSPSSLLLRPELLIDQAGELLAI
jgi:hypothetical protein